MSYDNLPPDPILPVLTDLNRPFWEGCAQGKLLLQRGKTSRQLRYPAALVCPFTLDPEYEWEEMSGRGKIFTYVVFDRVYHKSWEGRTPYTVALVELDEGPMMLTNIVGLDRNELEIGRAVQVDFEPLADGIAKPVFKPV